MNSDIWEIQENFVCNAHITHWTHIQGKIIQKQFAEKTASHFMFNTCFPHLLERSKLRPSPNNPKNNTDNMTVSLHSYTSYTVFHSAQQVQYTHWQIKLTNKCVTLLWRECWVNTHSSGNIMYGFVDKCPSFDGTCCLNLTGTCSEYTGRRFLQNTGTNQATNTASHHKWE